MVAKASSGKAEGKRTPEGQHEAQNAHHKIAELAYRLYLERGAQDGHALEDWLRAEQEVLGEEI